MLHNPCRQKSDLVCRLAIVCLAILLPFALFPLPCAAQGVITTVAGTTWAFRGDGGLATDAPLGRLQGVTVDSVGNVFAADTGNNHVVKISATGILTVVAGNGFTGFSGDDGIATSASLNLPFGVAVGLDGSLYIADVGNNRIRKVSPEGIITTVAGNGIGTGSTDGEGGDPADDLGDGGPATSASLGFPRGVATDAMGNLYIADTNNSRIRRMSAGGTITTIAGDGSAGFSGDGGPATAASLNQPGGGGGRCSG